MNLRMNHRTFFVVIKPRASADAAIRIRLVEMDEFTIPTVTLDASAREIEKSLKSDGAEFVANVTCNVANAWVG